MTKVAISLISLLSVNAYAAGACHKPLVIAVLDSGLSFNERTQGAKLCKFGHKDFTGEKLYSGAFKTKDSVPEDSIGHGTNIVGIIDSKMKASHRDYCIVIVKVFSTIQSKPENLDWSTNGFRYMLALKPDVINYSGGGNSFSINEYNAIERLLDRGTKVVAAAGNDSAELVPHAYSYFPGMYDRRITVVGNLTAEGNKNWTSNFGEPVTRWEIGTNVKGFGITLTGTSQATAVATGNIAATLQKRCDR